MQRWNALTALLSIALVTIGTSGGASAQGSSEEMLKQIQERTAKTREFRTLLNDPDQVTRLMALDVMLKSEDIAMQELAFGVCFSSADQAMRGVCLNNKLAKTQMINVLIKEKKTWTEKESRALEAWGGAYTINIDSFDSKTGHLKLRAQGYPGAGQVAGLRVEFAVPPCTGTFQLGDGGVLDGILGCNQNKAGTYPAEIRLQ